MPRAATTTATATWSGMIGTNRAATLAAKQPTAPNSA